MKDADVIANAIQRVLESPNESDSNLEAANVVDGLFALARAVRYSAGAITADASPGTDQFGNTIACLTEAVASVSVALSDIAAAIREHGEASAASTHE